MTKKAGRISKRRVMVIVCAVALLGLGAAGYFGYRWYSAYTAQKSAQYNAAKKAAASLNIAGNQDLAAQYMQYLQAGNTTAARKVFSDAVAHEPDVNKKVTLLLQNIQLALADKKPDEALPAAEQMATLQPTDDAYMQVVSVYIAKGDQAKQIEYLQKAIAAVQASQKPNKAALQAKYESQLKVTREIMAIREGTKN